MFISLVVLSMMLHDSCSVHLIPVNPITSNVFFAKLLRVLGSNWCQAWKDSSAPLLNHSMNIFVLWSSICLSSTAECVRVPSSYPSANIIVDKGEKEVVNQPDMFIAVAVELMM